MIEFLKRLLVLETANERAKAELALLYDFTFLEAFKLLDINSSQNIETEDMVKSLQQVFSQSRFT